MSESNACSTGMNAPPSMSVAEIWARFVAEHRYEALPIEARESAKGAIADCVGSIIAGIDTKVGRSILTLAATERGSSHVWGGSPATARMAALANGTMGHAQDIDDCMDTMRGHPSVPVVPAVLAVGDEMGASGRDLIAAYIAGVEIEGRIGKATMVSHPERGWHTTLTLGTLGATIAVANLLRLSIEQTQNALGLAVSMASGLRVNFGTMTKPVHAGLAAQNGILAAQLAAAGIDASPRALEGKQGFFDVLAGYDGTTITHAIPNSGDPLQVVEPGIKFKLYPSCDISHPAIDIVLGGIASGEIDVKDIKEVKCAVGYRLHTNMIYEKALTGFQGKFCLPYCIAAALHYRRVGFEQFTDEAVLSSDIQALLKKIDVFVHPDLRAVESLNNDFTDLIVTHNSGRVFHRRMTKPKGHPTNPLSPDEHLEKFFMCTSAHLGRAGAKRLWNRLMELDDLQLSDLYRN